MSQREEKLRRLWDHIINADEESRKKIIEAMDEQTLLEMRTVRNPFKKPVYQPGGERDLAFCVINVREKYAQRFAMTSLLSFLYRLLHEYKAPSNLPSEDEPRFAQRMHEKVRHLEETYPLRQWEEQMHIHSPEDPQWREAKACTLQYRLRSLRKKITQEELELQTRQGFLQGAQADVQNQERLLKISREKMRQRQEYEEGLLTREAIQERWNNVDKEERHQLLSLQDLSRKVSEWELFMEKVARALYEGQAKKERLEREVAEESAQLQNWQEEEKALQEEMRAYERVPIPAYSDYEASEEDYERLSEEVKKELAIERTAEEEQEEVRVHIETFLDEFFRYNPDKHVRRAAMAGTEENAVAGTEEKEIPVPDPPSDAFYRWNNYTENNYEELRRLTDACYAERSDVEFAIAPLEVVSGRNREEVNKEFDKFKRKYQKEFDASIHAAKFNDWTLLAAWKENREVTDFFTEETEVIKRIVEAHKEDEREGAKIMQEKIARHKKEADPGLNHFLKQHDRVQELEKRGAKRADKLPGFKAHQIPRDEEEASMKEVEVQVSQIKPKFGRRHRGRTKQWKFNIPAQELPEGSVNVKTAAEIQRPK